VFELVRLVSGWAVVCVGIAAGIGMSGCHSASKLTQQEIAGKYLYLGRCAHCHEENDLALRRFRRTALCLQPDHPPQRRSRNRCE